MSNLSDLQKATHTAERTMYHILESPTNDYKCYGCEKHIDEFKKWCEQVGNDIDLENLLQNKIGYFR